ncbi:hypothetical protein BaRGS_00009215 [Batillaria attramentaria]|uniref:Endonuclease/exonuclease/phosphatase domain-containing protein n=1 Tax=Batillaria attramentaria TaxID=370345 RepID=A0ABD0LKC5_9CAEN
MARSLHQSHASFALLILILTFALCSMQEVTVCTYNIRNLVFSWEVRLRHFANMVESAGCEVLVLQEVRIHGDERWSQAQHLKRLLPRFRWAVCRAAGPVSKPPLSYWDGWEKEGLAVLSQWPLGQAWAWRLPQSLDTADTSQRLALHVPIDISSTRLHVIAVHFSTDRRQQCQEAADILAYIKRRNLNSVIVAGDLSTYTDFPDPVRLFIGSISNEGEAQASNCQGAVHTDSRPFQDAWVAALGPNSTGFTFSIMPSASLISRPDRILVSGDISVLQTSLHGNGTEYTSRHLDILLHRLWVIVRSAKAAALGYSGYSCLQDCGPSGVCRCGVCVQKVINTYPTIDKACECLLPHCRECSPGTFLVVCGFVAMMVVLLALTGLAVVKVLVVSAHFDQSATFQILGCTCCLFNLKLLSTATFTTRNRIGRILWRVGIGQLPPAILFFLCLSMLGLCSLAAVLALEDMFNTMRNVMEEELLPSDHLMLAATLRVL